MQTAKNDFFGFFGGFVFHTKCHQKITTPLRFEDSSILPLPLALGSLVNFRWDIMSNMEVMGSKELKCVISGQNGPKMTILRHYDVISPDENHFENFKMGPLGSLVNFASRRPKVRFSAHFSKTFHSSCPIFTMEIAIMLYFFLRWTVSSGLVTTILVVDVEAI